MFCGVYLFAPELILRPYGLADHEALRELVVHLLRFVAVYSFFDAMFVVFNAAIRGAGDTRFALVFSFSMGLVLLVLPTYVASHCGAAGFDAAWYAVTVYITVLGLGFLARFQQGTLDDDARDRAHAARAGANRRGRRSAGARVGL